MESLDEDETGMIDAMILNIYSPFSSLAVNHLTYEFRPNQHLWVAYGFTSAEGMSDVQYENGIAPTY